MRIWFSKERSGLFINREHSMGHASYNLGYAPYFIIRLLWSKCPVFGIDGWWWHQKMDQLKRMLGMNGRNAGQSTHFVLQD